MSLNRDVAPTTLGSLMRRTSAERGMTSAVSRAPAVVGNASSMIYHWPGCPGYAKTSARNRVEFGSRGTAESDGYRAARNCRSEEHTSELQSLMRTSYAVFCLKKKRKHN